MSKNQKKSIRLFLPAVFICFSILFIFITQPVLTSVEINEDLDQFQNILKDRFAYLKVNDPDYKPAVQNIREKGLQVFF